MGSKLEDLISAAAHDPVVIALVLFAVAAAAAQLLARRHPVRPALARVVFLLLLTAAFVRADIVPYQVQPPTSEHLLDFIHRVLKIAWWLLTAWLAVGLLRAIVIVERRPRESRILQDILAGLIYLAAFFAIAAYVFDLPVQGLFATSGVLAIILGLALQSSLGDVFSGLVLNLSRPYLPGDWVNVEGGTVGRVIELNWRATHILTERRDLAIVPNSTIAKARIINVSSPSDVHGVTLTLQLAAEEPPSVGKGVLEQALLNCRLVCATPAASVTVKAMTASYVEFELTFFVEDLSVAPAAQNELLDLVYRHLVAAGVELAPAPNQPPRPEDPPARPSKANRVERLFGLVGIFRALAPEERKALAAKAKPVSCEAGTVVEPGKVLSSLFIVGSGVLSATRDTVEILRLGPGDTYGEIGMLTGAPSPARLAALGPVVLYELTKEALAPVLAARPEIAHELSRELARRLAASRLANAPDLDRGAPAHQLSDWFLDRLHRLFDYADGD